MLFTTLLNVLVVMQTLSGFNVAAIPVGHDLSRRMAHFASDDEISFSATEKLKLGKKLGEGAEGAAWVINVPSLHRDLVAKEMAQPLTAQAEFDKTAKAGQFHSSFVQKKNGAVFGFYTLVLGEKIHAFPEWQRVKAGSRTECIAWLKRQREAIANARVKYAKDRHIIHDDFANGGNVLFKASGVVDLIDWGQSRVLSAAPGAAELEKIKKEAITAMETANGLNPFSDSKCPASRVPSPVGGKAPAPVGGSSNPFNPWA